MTVYFDPTNLPLVKQHTYSQIGSAKNSKRIWLEGGRLSDCGFTKGVAIAVHYNPDNFQLTFVRDPKATKVVSGRVSRTTGRATPIIDLRDKGFPAVGTRIRVTFMDGVIVVSLHHEDRKRLDREKRLLAIASGKRVMKEGSLCTGIGVSTLAAHETLHAGGINTQVDWVIDIEGKYLNIASLNNPAITKNTQLIVGALEEVEPELLSQVDLLTVSLPCTGFSISGRSKLGLSIGEAHPSAATAVFGAIQIIKQTNPSIIVSENVTQARGSATYMLLIAELQRLGYTIKESILSGADAGTLENRERYFFVALSNGVSHLFDFANIEPKAKVFTTMGDIMAPSCETADMWKTYDYLDTKAARDLKAGKGFKRQFATPETETIGVCGRGYAKARSTECFWKRSDGLQRLLTTTEHAKVKLIPEKLVEGVSVRVAHEGLGQSILFPHVVLLIERVVEGLRNLARSVLTFA